MPLLSESFITNFKNDPITNIILFFDELDKTLGVGQSTDASWVYLSEAYSFITEVLKAKILPIEFDPPFSFSSLGTDNNENCSKVYNYLYQIKQSCIKLNLLHQSDSLSTKFKTLLGVNNDFSYEFSESDLNTIQETLHRLRKLISEADYFSEEHQQRLLSRLEKLQSEMHKKISDLDRFWGLIGDAGIMLGKFGEQAKPIIDRIRDVADIVWQTQSRTEKLPNNAKFPFLAHKSSNE